MNKYLIVIDLDGTTLTSNNTLHETTKKALKTLIKLGHIVIIATGRSLKSSLKYYHELGLNTFMITRNGAFVYSPISNEIMMMIDIPKKTLYELFYGAINEDILEIYVDSKTESYCLKSSEKSATITGNISDKNITACTLLVEDKKIERVIKHLNLITDIKYDYWDFKNNLKLIEIYPKIADKSITIGYFADYYRISHKNIIAIGDGNNDLRLIKNASYGIAVSNATEKLKANAKKVLTGTNNDGAVGVFLNEFFKL